MQTAQQAFEALVQAGDLVLDRLDACARDFPDKTFIHYGEDGVRLTFAQFKARTDRLAAGLATLGLQPGMPVGVLTRNSLVAALSMFAIWRAGGVFAPVNFNFTAPLVAYQLDDTQPFALVTDVSFAPVLTRIADRIGLRRLVVHTPAATDHDATHARFEPGRHPFELHAFEALADSPHAVPSVARGPFDVANIVYTSGTTGPSKGVVQPYRWINHYTLPGRQLHAHDDVLYCDLPLYHVGGAFAVVARAVWLGNTVGLWDRFSAHRFWDRIAECGASFCHLLDVMVPWLMSAEPGPADRANTLNKVHMQPLPSNHQAVARRFGFDFVSCGFGQTESGVGFRGLIDELGDEPGTPPERWKGLSRTATRERARALGVTLVDGREPLPGGFMGSPNPLLEVGVLNEHDEPCPPGTTGQLCLRPRYPGLILQEYLRKPEATARALRNCWFHTGDAVRQLDDGSGRYVFVDRMGGVIRVRGENVSSYEVEVLIASHPAVRAAAAVPLPARVGDEDEIAVFVELADGATATEAELRAHAVNAMPRYMQPTHIRFVDALPVTATNKIEKYKLKQRLLDELGLAERC